MQVLKRTLALPGLLFPARALIARDKTVHVVSKRFADYGRHTLITKRICYFLFFLTSAACKQSYNPPVKIIPTGYLVVEGFINSGGSATTIKLTRTTTISDTTNIKYEQGATVQIEGSANDVFGLTETTNGIYTSAPLTLNPAEQYHLYIKTAEGKEYLSDPDTLKQTPAIDSVSWSRDNSGVQVYVNTHDPTGTIKYYLWNYVETWERHSTYAPSLKFVVDANQLVTGLGYRLPLGAIDSSIFKCWTTHASSDVLIGSTEKLTTGVVYLQPLSFIPAGSVQMGILYTINVKQYAIGEAAYQFYQKLKTNTEQLGTIFDAQPSGLTGNIHCTTNPAELVVGYVDVSKEQSSRIFIYNNQLPDWDYSTGCKLDVMTNSIRDVPVQSIPILPVQPYKQYGTTIFTFFESDKNCVDCTLNGSNQKPDFWPY